MGLLAANLSRIDELGFPAYLESTNQANDHRYERLASSRVESSRCLGRVDGRLHVARSAVNASG